MISWCVWRWGNRERLAWVVWLRASAEVAVKLSARARGPSYSVAQSHGWQVGEAIGQGPQFLTLWASPWAAWASLQRGVWLPPEGGIPRGQGRSMRAFGFAIMLLRTQGQRSSVWEEGPPEHEQQEVKIAGATLESVCQKQFVKIPESYLRTFRKKLWQN